MGSLKLATGGDDIKFWDIPSYNLHQQYSPHESTISDMSWSYDGQFLASSAAKGDKIVLSYISNGNFSTGDVAANVSAADQHCVRFSSITARFLMTGGKDGQVNIWDMKNRKLKRAYMGHTDVITRVQFNWNDTYIVSGSSKGDILIHNITTGQASSPLRAPKVQAIRDLRYNAVRRALFGSASDDGSLNLWDANSRRLTHQFVESHSAPAMGLCFSPFNEVLMTSVGLDKKLVYYDLQVKKPVKVYSGDEPFTCIDIMHDGVTVAAGTLCGKVHVYDLRKSSDPVQSILAHKAAVQCLAFQNKSTSKHTDPPVTSRGGSRSASYSPKRVPLSSSSSSCAFEPSSQSNATSTARRAKDSGIAMNAVRGVIGNDVSATGDRSSYRGSPMNRSTGSSMSGCSSVFSPPRDDCESPEPAVRKQPIGGGLCKPTKALGDRPVTTGFADADGLTNGSLPDAAFLVTTRQSPPVLKRRAASSSPRSSRIVNHERRKGERSASQAKIGSLPSSAFFDLSSKIPTRSCGPSGEEQQPDLPFLSRDEGSSPLTNGACATPPLSSSMMLMSSTYTSTTQDRLTPVLPSKPVTSEGASSLSSGDTVGSLVSAGEPAPMGATGGCAIPFSMEQMRQLVQEVVHDAMDDLQESVHQDIAELHVDMVRQFLFQKAEIESLLRYYSINEDLVTEIERLREENKRLQARF